MDDRVPLVSWFLSALASLLGEVAAQRPAWIPRDQLVPVNSEMSWFDPQIGRPVAWATNGLNGTSGPVVELDGVSWIRRVAATAPTSIMYLGAKVAYAEDRQVAVMVIPGSPPASWEWDGAGWRAAATPTSLPPSTCISSLSWSGRPGAQEVLATTGGQVWGYDGTDWRYRGGLPFDPQFSVYVPTLNLHLFGLRGGGWSSSMIAWDGANTLPVTATGTIPPDGRGAGKRVVFDVGAGRLVMTGHTPTLSTTEPYVTFAAVPSIQGNAVSLAMTQLQNSPNPLGDGGYPFPPSLVYDSVRHRAVYIYGGHYGLQVFDLPSGSDTWTRRQGIGALPAGRSGIDLAYDRQRQQTVMFGGSDANQEFLAETWTFDGAHWQSRGVAPNVAGRNQAALAYVGSIGRTLMFGGNTESAGVIDELWSWDGSQWLGMGNAAPRPAARSGHDMVWHEARNRVVLFGGQGGPFVLDDTWEYDPIAQSWQPITTPVAPAARNFAKMVYDRQRERVVLFGGAGPAGVFDDTWVYSTPVGGWTQAAAPTRPQGRWGHAMEYDPQRNRVVVFGGFGYVPCGSGLCQDELNDHWEFDSTTWVSRPSGPSASPGTLNTPMPPIRGAAGMTFDSGRQRMVLYGGFELSGFTATYRGDTWEFDSGIDTFSTGQASGGIALRSLRPALAGGDLALEFESPYSFGWMAVHLETVPSPTHFVDPPIACGSRAWFYGLQPIVASVGGNPGVLQFQLPTWLLGLGMEFQAIALDAPGLCLRVSDPLALTVQAP